MQSAYNGFGLVDSENVYKVCDEPHPLLIKQMITKCIDGKYDDAYKTISDLWKMGYSPEDIITNIFKVVKAFEMPEYLKLEFIKEIGITHLRITKGVNSLLQLSSLIARFCSKIIKSK